MKIPDDYVLHGDRLSSGSEESEETSIHSEDNQQPGIRVYDSQSLFGRVVGSFMKFFGYAETVTVGENVYLVDSLSLEKWRNSWSKSESPEHTSSMVGSVGKEPSRHVSLEQIEEQTEGPAPVDTREALYRSRADNGPGVLPESDEISWEYMTESVTEFPDCEPAPEVTPAGLEELVPETVESRFDDYVLSDEDRSCLDLKTLFNAVSDFWGKGRKDSSGRELEGNTRAKAFFHAHKVAQKLTHTSERAEHYQVLEELFDDILHQCVRQSKIKSLDDYDEYIEELFEELQYLEHGQTKVLPLGWGSLEQSEGHKAHMGHLIPVAVTRTETDGRETFTFSLLNRGGGTQFHPQAQQAGKSSKAMVNPNKSWEEIPVHTMLDRKFWMNLLDPTIIPQLIPDTHPAYTADHLYYTCSRYLEGCPERSVTGGIDDLVAIQKMGSCTQSGVKLTARQFVDLPTYKAWKFESELCTLATALIRLQNNEYEPDEIPTVLECLSKSSRKLAGTLQKLHAMEDPAFSEETMQSLVATTADLLRRVDGEVERYVSEGPGSETPDPAQESIPVTSGENQALTALSDALLSKGPVTATDAVKDVAYYAPCPSLSGTENLVTDLKAVMEWLPDREEWSGFPVSQSTVYQMVHRDVINRLELPDEDMQPYASLTDTEKREALHLLSELQRELVRGDEGMAGGGNFVSPGVVLDAEKLYRVGRALACSMESSPLNNYVDLVPQTANADLADMPRFSQEEHRAFTELQTLPSDMDKEPGDLLFACLVGNPTIPLEDINKYPDAKYAQETAERWHPDLDEDGAKERAGLRWDVLAHPNPWDSMLSEEQEAETQPYWNLRHLYFGAHGYAHQYALRGLLDRWVPPSKLDVKQPRGKDQIEIQKAPHKYKLGVALNPHFFTTGTGPSLCRNYPQNFIRAAVTQSRANLSLATGRGVSNYESLKATPAERQGYYQAFMVGVKADLPEEFEDTASCNHIDLLIDFYAREPGVVNDSYFRAGFIRTLLQPGLLPNSLREESRSIAQLESFAGQVAVQANEQLRNSERGSEEEGTAIELQAFALLLHSQLAQQLGYPPLDKDLAENPNVVRAAERFTEKARDIRRQLLDLMDTPGLADRRKTIVAQHILSSLTIESDDSDELQEYLPSLLAIEQQITNWPVWGEDADLNVINHPLQYTPKLADMQYSRLLPQLVERLESVEDSDFTHDALTRVLPPNFTDLADRPIEAKGGETGDKGAWIHTGTQLRTVTDDGSKVVMDLANGDLTVNDQPVKGQLPWQLKELLKNVFSESLARGFFGTNPDGSYTPKNAKWSHIRIWRGPSSSDWEGPSERVFMTMGSVEYELATPKSVNELGIPPHVALNSNYLWVPISGEGPSLICSHDGKNPPIPTHEVIFEEGAAIIHPIGTAPRTRVVDPTFHEESLKLFEGIMPNLDNADLLVGGDGHINQVRLAIAGPDGGPLTLERRGDALVWAEDPSFHVCADQNLSSLVGGKRFLKLSNGERGIALVAAHSATDFTSSAVLDSFGDTPISDQLEKPAHRYLAIPLDENEDFAARTCEQHLQAAYLLLSQGNISSKSFTKAIRHVTQARETGRPYTKEEAEAFERIIKLSDELGDWHPSVSVAAVAAFNAWQMGHRSSPAEGMKSPAQRVHEVVSVHYSNLASKKTRLHGARLEDVLSPEEELEILKAIGEEEGLRAAQLRGREPRLESIGELLCEYSLPETQEPPASGRKATGAVGRGRRGPAGQLIYGTQTWANHLQNSPWTWGGGRFFSVLPGRLERGSLW